MRADDILTSFQNLCDTPLGWFMLAIASLKAGHSIWSFRRCPLLKGSADTDARAAQARLASPVLRSPRFMVSMLVGLTLAIGGLYTVQDPQIGHFAIAAVVTGVFVMLVEPSQLSIDECALRLAALGSEGEAERRDVASERLRAAHLERVTIEALFALGLGVVVTIY